MRTPLIGISTYLEPSVQWGEWNLPAAVLPAGYHMMVQRVGGIACLLPPGQTASVKEVVSRLDALIITGGPDVEPSRYGAERHPKTGPPYQHRDRWELALIGTALIQRKPVLGICRGMQLLNVALGGTLVQHLPDVVRTPGHSGPPGVFARHLVRPVPGTTLFRAMPEAAMVPTYHHQAVDRLGNGLVSSAFADDGTIEAIESETAGAFALGVQWHPEAGRDHRIVDALVRAAVPPSAKAPRSPRGATRRRPSDSSM
ncbi:gamma-glutamyl-gamma-aminobutyrate hydrolase family protein [Streptomyces sp. NPDC087908]|uniref:gamma-glutamyl-gamma-aminobutyrate hydrolase family protein n=1 Tax=Streptomyces sp. NPDC087908 TaxID=3365820 RepID=UPI0037F8885F